MIDPIEWPGHNKPVDEPHCGYVGEKCASQKGKTEYAAAVLGGKILLATTFCDSNFFESNVYSCSNSIIGIVMISF